MAPDGRVFVQREEEIEKELQSSIAQLGVGQREFRQQRQLQHCGQQRLRVALQDYAGEVDAAQLAAALVDVVDGGGEEEEASGAEVAALKMQQLAALFDDVDDHGAQRLRWGGMNGAVDDDGIYI
jgi:hypothetical protein